MNLELNNSVIKIKCENKCFDWWKPYEIGKLDGSASGTGFFIRNDLIVTCAHVIEDAAQIQFIFPNNPKIYFAKVLLILNDLDVAILKPINYENDKFLEIANQEILKNLNIGDKVYAAGYPAGIDNLSTTDGSFNAREGIFYQIQAPINPGNSGGPLFKDGKVIGINVQKKVGRDIDSMGYALPIHYMTKYEDEYLNYTNSDVKIIYSPTLYCKYSKTNPKIMKKITSKKDSTGILLNKIHENSNIKKLIKHKKLNNKISIVLTKFNGFDINNNGKIYKKDSNSNIEFKDVYKSYKAGEKVKLDLYIKEKGCKPIHINTEIILQDKKHNFLKKYPNYQKNIIQYELFDTLTLVDFSLNHFRDMLHYIQFEDIRSKLTGFLKLSKLFENRILLTDIFKPGDTKTYLDIKIGSFLTHINDQEINTIEKFREKVLEILNTKEDIKLTFDDNKIIIIPTQTSEEKKKLIKDSIVERGEPTKFMKKIMKLANISYSEKPKYLTQNTYKEFNKINFIEKPKKEKKSNTGIILGSIAAFTLAFFGLSK